jgi:hypothetical protein
VPVETRDGADLPDAAAPSGRDAGISWQKVDGSTNGWIGSDLNSE